jgi:release factor glutamine methyltransferase
LHLYTDFDQPLSPAELTCYLEAVKRRVQRQPVAYITGCREFMGLEFAVNPAVLIPRPDTEILVEAALARLTGLTDPVIADLGTGSGAIAVSILANLPGGSGVAVDVSPEALAVARENADRLGVAGRLEFCRGDMLEPLNNKKFDAILSNPPYIPDSDIAVLSAEVRQEPRLALAGGSDGLTFYRRLVAQAANYLKPGGFMAVEVGVDQAGPVAALAGQGSLLKAETVIKDYAGIERVIVFTLWS